MAVVFIIQMRHIIVPFCVFGLCVLVCVCAVCVLHIRTPDKGRKHISKALELERLM